MKLKEIDILQSEAADLLRKGQFNRAFDILEEKILAERQFAPLRRDLDHLRETYGYLVRFALAGTDDPSRPAMLASIASSVMAVIASMRRILKGTISPTLYYSTLRTLSLNGEHPDLRALVSRCREAATRRSMALFAGKESDSPEMIALKRDLEKAEAEIFRVLWTRFPLGRDDEQALRELIDDETFGAVTRSVVVGALYLGTLETFDLRRLTLLLDLYQSPKTDRHTSLFALLCLLIAMSDTADQTLLEPLRDHLSLLAEEERWRLDVGMVFRQFLNSCDTDRVNRMMNDTILPSMRDLGSELGDSLKNIDLSSPDSIDASEWQDLFENSDFSRNIREMTRMQAEGGDVMFSTFTHMKGFPFFREIVNWFIPYHPDHSELASSLGGRPGLAEMISASPQMCDNDRFSMALGFTRAPLNRNRDEVLKKDSEMNSSMLEMTRQMEESRRQDPDYEKTRDRESLSNHARNLYRFFRLYERHDEFRNPFETSLNLLGVSVLEPSLSRADLVAAASDFLYSHGYFAEALPLLKERETDVPPDDAARLYFAIGDCCYRTGDLDGALTFFERSELFDGKNRDTVMRLAYLYHKAGNFRKAESYIRRAIATAPKPSRKLDLLLARELVETEKYSEAIELFSRLDFDSPLTDGDLRLLARCRFSVGDYPKIPDTLSRVARPTAGDWMTRSAVSILGRDFEGAAAELSLAASSGGMMPDRLIDGLRHYDAAFTAAGIAPELVGIVADEAVRRLK
ncbi:MAG: tetratricopeptide repeat protein [Clostridium sp.]|nr:tetratricopeptide repeat protein [Clostridium sp.]